MPESQEIALPARRHFKPRAFRAAWALDAACGLDAVSPGFLAHVIYASDLKRQTIFMSLGEVHARQAVAVRLRHVLNPDEFTIRDPLTHTARALVVPKPRQIIQALFGAVPDGLLGALARLGPQPHSDPSFYRELFGLFAHPMHRARANLLRQASGKLTETKVRIALILDSSSRRRPISWRREVGAAP